MDVLATCPPAAAELPEDHFWSLIELVGDLTRTDRDAYEHLVDALTRLTAKEVAGFEATLARLLYQLDDRRLGDVVVGWQGDELDGYLSADFFLYLRCGIVARGRTAYRNVLARPELAHSMLEWEQQDEALLSVADDARRRAGIAFRTTPIQYDYETWSNRSGWT